MSEQKTLTAAADHPKFTETTWRESLRGSYLTPDSAERNRLRDWMRLHDLALELAETTGWAFEWARELVSATVAGHPIILTWEKVRADGMGQQEIMRTTATVIVRSLGPTGLAHISTWGFGHPVYPGELVDVQVPHAEYSFEFRPSTPAAA